MRLSSTLPFALVALLLVCAFAGVRAEARPQGTVTAEPVPCNHECGCPDLERVSYSFIGSIGPQGSGTNSAVIPVPAGKDFVCTWAGMNLGHGAFLNIRSLDPVSAISTLLVRGELWGWDAPVIPSSGLLFEDDIEIRNGSGLTYSNVRATFVGYLINE